MTARVRNEEGSILPLIAVYAALCLAVILVVVAATSLYLERKRLFTVADGAALAGAEAFTVDGPAAAAGHPQPTLTDGEVSAAVAGFLRSAPPTDIAQLHVERASAPDGRSAVVTLSGWWKPPVLTLFVPAGIRIEVTARARAVFS